MRSVFLQSNTKKFTKNSHRITASQNNCDFKTSSTESLRNFCSMKESKRLRRMQGGRICAKGEVWTQTKILSPNIFCKNSLMLRSSVTFKPTCSNCFEITLITIVFDSRVQYSWLISFIVALVTFEELFWSMSSHVHIQILCFESM